MEKIEEPSVVEPLKEFMNDNERITTILIDTCAFRDANSDFIGVHIKAGSGIIQRIENNEIELLLFHFSKTLPAILNLLW